MARNYISEDTDTLYRAVITKRFVDGSTRTNTYGPYKAQAPATAAITRADTEAAKSRNGSRWYDGPHTIEGRVEVAHVTWVRPQ